MFLLISTNSIYDFQFMKSDGNEIYEQKSDDPNITRSNTVLQIYSENLKQGKETYDTGNRNG